jgi:hypothetical protein
MTRATLTGAMLLLLVSLILPAAPGQAQTPTPVPTATVTVTPVATASGLTVTAVSPPSGSAVSPTPLTITGTGFAPGASVVLGTRVLPATFISPTQLQVTVPFGFPPGQYNVSVSNVSSSSSATLPNGYTVMGLGSTLYVPIAVKQANGDDSGIQVQNTSTTSASVYVIYYDQSGNAVTMDGPQTVAGGGSWTFYQPTNVSLPGGFDGSAVVHATQSVAAIVNRVNYTGANASAGSITIPSGAGANQVTVPLVYGGQNGYNTTISIQNTSNQNATYTVNAYQNGLNTIAATLPVTIPAMAVRRLRVGTDLFVPGGFIGNVSISSTAATATAVAETRNSTNGIMLSYAGATTGTLVSNAPLLFKNYNGWVAGAQVVNMSNTAITVTATLHNRDDNLTYGLPPQTLAPNQSYFYDLATVTALPDGFVGSGVFTATGPAAVTVQEVNAGQNAGMGYSGFSTGTTNISIPLIFKESNGWNTGVQVQNLGTIDTNVTITYTLPSGFTVGETSLVTAGKSVTFYQPANAGLQSGLTGAAMVTSTGQPIVAIVNEVNYQRTGDASMAYEGINY